jgi:hypothetical protein
MSILSDLLFIAGLGAVVYGAYLIYLPAAFIIGGIGLVFIGIIVARKTN